MQNARKQDKNTSFHIHIISFSQHEIYCILHNYSTGAERIQEINWNKTMPKTAENVFFLHKFYIDAIF